MALHKRNIARLRALKEDAGLTWPALARAFGVGERTISNWLYGPAGMSSTTLRLLEIYEGNRAELAKWSADGAPIRRRKRRRRQSATKMPDGIPDDPAATTAARLSAMRPGDSLKAQYGQLDMAAVYRARAAGRVAVTTRGQTVRVDRL